jgi:rubrerythrin
MPLNSFSSILEFAEIIEIQNRTIFKAAGAAFSFTEFREFFDMLAATAGKRLKQVQRMRRENISEMVLETITGLEREQFVINDDASESLSIIQAFTISKDAIKRTIRYYSAAADKLSRHPEVSGRLAGFSRSLEKDLQTLVNFQ